MPIAKLPDVRLALVCRRLPRDAVILVREYVEGPARFFYNVRPDEEVYDEWKPGMELIVKFLGQEAWLSFGATNHSVRMSLTWILIAMADSLFRPGSSDAEEEILS